MPVKRGNISGSISTVPFNVPCKVISFFLTNRTTGTITVNAYIVTSTGGQYAAIPMNLVSISGTIYTSNLPIILLAGDYFIIASSGSMDYYISFDPI